MKIICPDPGRTLYATDAITGVSITPIGTPPVVEISDSTITAWAELAYTPDKPTTTIGWDGDPEAEGVSVISWTYGIWRGLNITGGVRHLRCWVKRKAGATLAIKAQILTLQGHDGSSYVTIGKVGIGATAAGTDDPPCDYVDIIRAAAFDTRITFGTANPFKIISSLSQITGGAIDATTDIYTKAAHGLETGDAISLTSLTGGTGLTAGTLYYFHKLSSSTGYICSSLANALAGTAVNVTLAASNVVLTPVDANIEIRLELAGVAS